MQNAEWNMKSEVLPNSLYRRPAVEGFSSLSRSTIYRGIAEGWFPAPVKVGPRAVAWRGSDLLAWLESRESRAA